MYIVEGGIYKDTTFTEIVEKEFYGPFETYKTALIAWRRYTFTQLIDNCCHRLKIYKDN